jgi:hypothetical protein
VPDSDEEVEEQQTDEYIPFDVPAYIAKLRKRLTEDRSDV